MRLCLALAFAVSVLGPASPALGQAGASGQAVVDVRVTEGIVYGQGAINQPAPASADLSLDLYEPLPRTDQRRPAVVLIHGGGFQSGSRTQSQLVSVARGLAERGTVVVSIDYRLSPQDPVPSTRVAAAAAEVPIDVPIFRGMVTAIDDALTALDWLDQHANELWIDPKRLGVAGGSAGAITANHLAYVLDDLGIEAPRIRFVGDLWGGIYIPLNPGLEAAANQLEGGEAPLFVVHGSADSTVPVVLDDWLVARARAVGVPVEYHRVEGAGHGFVATQFLTREVAPGQTAFDRMLDFAEAALGTTADGSATAKRTQRQKGKRIAVKLKLKAEENLEVKATGKVRVNPTYALKPRSADVAAGEKRTLKLKPRRKSGVRRIAKALSRGKSAKAKLTVKLTDEVGNSTSEKLSVKLKR